MGAGRGGVIALRGRCPPDGAPQGTETKGMTGKRLSRSGPAKGAAPEPPGSEEADGSLLSLRQSRRDHSVASKASAEPGTGSGRSARPGKRRAAQRPRAASAPESPAPTYPDYEKASPRGGLPSLTDRTTARAAEDLLVIRTYVPDLDSQVSAILAVLASPASSKRRDSS
jgi:hypothetical protein